MLSQKIRDLKSSYQNGEVLIGEELIKPCLGACIRYRRGTGYFNSSALIHYADVLDYVIKKRVKIEIICSPKIDQTLLRVLEKHVDQSDSERLLAIKRDVEKIFLVALGHSRDPKNIGYREKLLTYFIATGLLEIRFAIPKQLSLELPVNDDRNMYHVKTGYFVFENEEWVSFDGSFNESDGGLRWNTDRTQVFRSWKGSDAERGLDVISSVDRDWEGSNPYIAVFGLEDSTLELVRRMSQKDRPTKRRNEKHFSGDKQDEDSPVLIQFPTWFWKHQKLATQTFLQRQCGILEMATGTGKTRTALEIVRQLFLLQKIKSLVVCTYGTDLLNQWYENVNGWLESSGTGFAALRVLRNYDTHRELQSYLNYPTNSILILSRDPNNLRTVLTHRNFTGIDTLILHDEIHGFGSPRLVAELSGTHSSINYRLGLSATPEREYDEEGSKFIENEVGPVIFTYGLPEAISDGVLCEFDYKPLFFAYTQEDADAKKSVYARKAASEKEGRPWDSTRLFIELSRVNKKAVMKPATLQRYLQENPLALKSSIIFVLDREQGDQICRVVEQFTYRYKTYYAGVDAGYLGLLSGGEIDTLIACERLNEGVDIRSLKTVFLVASDRARLDTIQRIGRCLRKDPKVLQKRALVVDFILEKEKDDNSDSADEERMRWLEGISKSRFVGEKNDYS
jgi:superfamily II DNA or RNA helicase